MVRETLLSDRHFLGIRRRWFEYTPPEGWRSRPRGFATEWTPPGFPREQALLVVWPALPSAGIGGVEGAFDGLFGTQGDAVATLDHADPATMAAASGLTGHEWHLVRSAGKSSGLHTHAVALVDERYVYPMRLELSEGAQRAHHQVLHQVARTIVPVPKPVASGETVTAGIWND